MRAPRMVPAPSLATPSMPAPLSLRRLTPASAIPHRSPAHLVAHPQGMAHLGVHYPSMT